MTPFAWAVAILAAGAGFVAGFVFGDVTGRKERLDLLDRARANLDAAKALLAKAERVERRADRLTTRLEGPSPTTSSGDTGGGE